MSVPKDLAFKSATIFDATRVYSGNWEKAMQHVASGLSRKESGPSPAYAIVVHPTKRAKGTPNYLAAAKTFAKAYTLGLEAISRIKHEILTSPQQHRLQALEPEDYIHVFLGKATSRDIKRLMQPSPGIYIMPSHLDAGFLADLDLPPVPDMLRDVPLVIQIEDSGLMLEEESTALSGVRPAIETSVALDPEAAIDRDTLEWRKRFMAEHPAWTSAQIAQESTSRAKNQPAIASRWAKEKKVFAFDYQGQKWFPRFQFQDGRPVPAVSQVIKLFPQHATGWELAYFFTTQNANLSGRRPLDLLKQDPSRVVSLAQAFVHPADVF